MEVLSRQREIRDAAWTEPIVLLGRGSFLGVW